MSQSEKKCEWKMTVQSQSHLYFEFSINTLNLNLINFYLNLIADKKMKEIKCVIKIIHQWYS